MGWVGVGGGAFEGRIWQPSPHQICSLSEATDRVRFSAVSTLSEQDEETCVPSSSRVPHFGVTLSQSLLCSSHPPSVLTSTAHNHHPSQISHTHSAPPSGHNRCRDFLEPETLISFPKEPYVVSLRPPPLAATRQPKARVLPGKSQVTVHPRASWMAPSRL